MQFGLTLRARPLLRILQGEQPETSLTREDAHPIAAAVTDLGTIKSGMVVSLILESGSYKLVPGLVADATAYVAKHDGDAPKSRALGGMLSVISMAGQFTFETGYFDHDDAANFVSGAVISAYANGNAKAGQFKVAANGEAILARVKDGTAVRNLNAPADGGLPEDSQADDGRVVTLETRQNGATAVV